MKRRSILTALIVMGVTSGTVYLGSAVFNAGQSASPAAAKTDRVEADRARSFSLTDSNGVTATDRSFRGGWVVVFFGFTHCVDICPAALFKLSKALEAVGDQPARVRVAFITIDPDRDSARVLHAYLQAFGPRFVGLTGTHDQIRSTEDTFRAYADGINHSGSFYVLDPSGQFRRAISAESTIADLTASLRSAVRLDPTRDGLVR